MKHSPAFLKVVDDAREQVSEITIQDYLTSKSDDHTYVLIDVREDHEWSKGHLPEAIHLSKGIIERDIEQKYPDKATPLLLYCGGGYRSALAAQSLVLMGYTNVTSLDGGVSGWLAAEQQLIST